MEEKYSKAAIELCRDLIRCRSVSGHEQESVAVLQRAMKALGYEQVTVDRYGSITGRLRGGSEGPCVLLEGHLDTVPVGDESVWTVSPFEAIVQNGSIFGRGASDMKGAVAAMTVAAAWFAAENKNFIGTISIAGTVHEECFEGVASREISSAIQPDYVVIGEASDLKVTIGQRGRAEIVIETFGKPAHSAHPENGVNAVHLMTKIMDKIAQLPLTRHPVLGDGTCVLTDIKSLPYPGASVVPSNCRVTYDRRLLAGEKPETVIEPFQRIISELTDGDPDFRAKVYFAEGKDSCYTGESISATRFFPAWLHSEEEPFIRSVIGNLRQAGFPAEISYYSFCTNGSHYAGEAGIPTLGFGPSVEHLAHTVDEHIEVEQLISSMRGYLCILKALLQVF